MKEALASERSLGIEGEGCVCGRLSWRFGLAVAGLLLIVVVVLFIVACPAPRLLRLFTGVGDGWIYFGPMAYYMDYSVHSGSFPLWNPLMMCGFPIAANPQSGVFYPFNLLRSVLTFSPTLFKSFVGLELLMLGHLVFAGTFVALLCRALRLSRFASVISALGYTLSACVLRWAAENWSMFVTGSWMPCLLLLWHYSLISDTGRRRLYLGVLNGLALGTCILWGYSQYLVFMSVLLGMYSVLFRAVRYRETGDSVGSIPKAVLLDAWYLGIQHAVAFLISAVVLLPCVELAQLGARMGARMSGTTLAMDMTPYDFARPEILEYLLVYGGSPELQDFRAGGAGLLLLALAALMHRNRRGVILLGGSFLLLLDCSIGTPAPLASLINLVVPFPMSYPGRNMLIAMVPLAVLGGFGFDAVFCRGQARVKRVAWLVILCGLVLVPLFFLLGRETVVPVSRLAFWVPCVLGLLMLVGHRVNGRSWSRWVAVALLLVEVGVWNRELVPFYFGRVHIDEYDLDLSELRVEHPFWEDNLRGSDYVANTKLGQLRPSINGAEPLMLRRMHTVLRSEENSGKYNRRILAHEAMAENHHGNLFLKRSLWLAREYVVGALPGPDRLWPSTTTVFLEDASELSLPEVAFEELAESSVSHMAERKTVLEGLFFELVGNRYEARIPIVDIPAKHSALAVQLDGAGIDEVAFSFTNPETGDVELGRRFVVDRTFGTAISLEVPMPDFRPIVVHVSVLVEEGSAAPRFGEVAVLVDHGDEGGLVEILSRGPNSLVARLMDLPGARILTYVDAHYPGWRAYVDGVEVPIHVVNGAFKGVSVGAGTHEVRFVYRPIRFLIGLVITCSSVLMVFFFLVIRRGDLWRR